ncbi:GNAT family N-acetyltransferase [Desulfovibrio sp. SGI.169]|uniref:TraB/GumN family protein n=1 Tax=Desulfovibrio sp. SGI.169 TaxID=3420561 RepID=UPI003CFC409E
MKTDFLAQINALARVPEHSLPLMRAMSQGKPFCAGPYFFMSAGNWLMAVAYPLRGRYSHAAFEAALGEALEKSGATSCWAVGPDLPPRLHAHMVDSDRFYVLPAGVEPPARLRGPLRRAAAALRVEESGEFTPDHRRLWAEFMGRADRGEGSPLAPHVRELYARTPEALAGAGGHLRLLNAWDGEGRLAACLLLDYAPKKFTSYVLGAHSRAHYAPHAADLLFAAMLENARKAGKRYVHLGLGVNEGILRFKRKWGGRPYLPYVMAAWEEAPQDAREGTARALTLALLRAAAAPSPPLEERPPQRPFAMLWEVEKNDRRSWIGGTAHFFCYSFETSFSRLFRKVDTVLFEGPLDEDFLAAVDRHGKTLPPGHRPLLEMLDEKEIRRLERVVRGPEGTLVRWLGMEAARKADVRRVLGHARPWCAFFSLWTAFLERQGWRGSVDMEAWRVAHDMGKHVIGMENLEEQLASLDSVPVERVLQYLRACHAWKAMARRNMRAYLAGDLERMMGSSAEFPTRTGYVVNVRDQRFRERMRPYLEEGRCAVFVGAAHMVNLRHMLVEDGFSVRRCLPGLSHKLRALWRHDQEAR